MMIWAAKIGIIWNDCFFTKKKGTPKGSFSCFGC